MQSSVKGAAKYRIALMRWQGLSQTLGLRLSGHPLWVPLLGGHQARPYNALLRRRLPQTKVQAQTF